MPVKKLSFKWTPRPSTPGGADWDRGVKVSKTKYSAMRKAMIRAKRHFAINNSKKKK